MLLQKDLQAIEILLDRKLDQKFDEKLDQKFKENNKILKDEIIVEVSEKFDDMLSLVNEGFTGMQLQFDKLENEIAKRPTKEEIFSWADRRFIDLEIAKDRHDYLHIDELDKLPTPLEISKTLIKRGFKKIN